MEWEKGYKKILPPLRRSRKRKKPGAAPGTVEHTGERHLQEIQITIHDYDPDHLQEISVDTIQKVKPFLDQPSITWIKVYGLHEIDKLKSIWSFFDLHPLMQEDIVHTAQRPKVEYYDNCIFFVLRMLSFAEEENRLQAEQISLVLGRNFVMSFQETDNNYFKPVIDRLRLDDSRLRKGKTDYLTYALIDTIVDHYYGLVEHLADEIENLEDELLKRPDEPLLEQIHKLRREIIFFRKSVWPVRDAINSVIRDDVKFISGDTKLFLRDVYDHMVLIIENIENYRDMILGLHDMYMSFVSNKMNEVMKVLTVIATIFIPLTFIAGIYGMNFNPGSSPYNMPELNWYWGYPAALGVMVVVAITMVLYFKRKGWY